MKLSNRIYSVVFLIFCSSFLFTGCSTKQTYDYNSYRKDTGDKSINNSEAMHRATMRPYNVFGIRYYPFVANVGDKFDGIASWYGPDFHSKKTSNGEIYDMYDMTAAHKTLPMNTVVKVDNLDNGKSVIVRINDRGPFVRGRIIDLSNKAARDIEMVGKGTAKVNITVLGYNGEIENKDAPYSELQKNEPSNLVRNEKVDVLEPLEIKEKAISSTKVPVAPVSKPVINNKAITKPITTNVSNSNNNLLSAGKYSVQVGAFGQESGANKIKQDYQMKFTNNKIDVKKVLSNGKTLFKVFIGGFDSSEKAQSFKSINGLGSALVISN